MKEISNKVKKMEKENIHSKMGHIMKVNFKMIILKDKVDQYIQMVIIILENFQTIKNKVKENINFKMEIIMKGNGDMIKKQEWVHIFIKI